MGYLLPVSDWMEPGSGSEVRLTAGETAAMGVARSSITRSLGLEVPDLKGTKRGYSVPPIINPQEKGQMLRKSAKVL